jgi:phosphonate degradation associated HDIG domain protein
MTPIQARLLANIDGLFSERGGSEYHGESVTQLEHALQSAWLAEKDGQPPSLIAAALLHDLGHLLHRHGEVYLDQNLNDRHEEVAARFLAQAYGPAVTEPVRLHVPAKRYLVATRPGYGGLLSPTSIKSLELQGGPMRPEEVAAFEGQPHFAAAAALRQYDDRAKVVALETPPYAHFHRYLVGELSDL